VQYERRLTVEKTKPLQNVKLNQILGFETDQKDIDRAQEEARKLNMNVIGLYHSHPEAAAEMSPLDEKEALRWDVEIILSVRNYGDRSYWHLKAWTPNEDRTKFLPDSITVVEDEAPT
jgi:proteasome lid subunit RPN8/RPN11